VRRRCESAAQTLHHSIKMLRKRFIIVVHSLPKQSPTFTQTLWKHLTFAANLLRKNLAALKMLHIAIAAKSYIYAAKALRKRFTIVLKCCANAL
jgi:hypothetical protein